MNDRFIWKEGDLCSPGDDICCVDCKFRNRIPPEGFKKAICDKYDTIPTNMKPRAILFKNQDCDFYEKDSK